MKNLSLNDSGQVEAGELKAEDLPIHEHHLLYYTKEQCEAMFALAQHNHDDLYYKKIDVYTKGESITNFASKTHQHYASTVNVDTNNFNKNLTSAENTVQKALDKLDDLSGGGLPPANHRKMLFATSTLLPEWKATNNLEYQENTGHSILGVLRKTSINGNPHSTGFTVSANIDPDFQKHYATFSLNAINYINNVRYETISLFFASSISVIHNLEHVNTNKRQRFRIELKDQSSSGYDVISYNDRTAVTTAVNTFSINSLGRIKSTFYKGTGLANLVVTGDGTILRGDTLLIKNTSQQFTLTGGSPMGFSFQRLFTWADLRISTQPTLSNMQQKIFSVKAYWRDGSNWKEIENFRHEITGLGLQCTGTVYATTTYLQMNVLYIK